MESLLEKIKTLFSQSVVSFSGMVVRASDSWKENSVSGRISTVLSSIVTGLIILATTIMQAFDLMKRGMSIA